MDRLVSWPPGTSGRGGQRGVVAVVRRVVEEGGAVANAVSVYQDSMQGGLKHGKEQRDVDLNCRGSFGEQVSLPGLVTNTILFC